MRYKDWKFISLEFSDGVMDSVQHPYIVLLDSNNRNNNSHFLMIKCKTFNPIKHAQYIQRGTDIMVNLRRQSIANLVEPYEIDSSAMNIASDGVLSTDEFKNLGLRFYECVHNNGHPIYNRHIDDLKFRLAENKLI